MRVTGGCYCGHIRFEATVDPTTVLVCHCTDCQKLTGAAYRVVVRARADDFVLTGQPKVWIKTADSGNKRAHSFCPDCGSPVYSAAPENTDYYSLRVGTIDQAAALVPARQIWCRSALRWAMNMEGIPGVERQ